MSDSESDAENEKNHRPKKSIVVKFQFEDNSSDNSDVAGPSNRIHRPKRNKQMALNSSDESSSDSDIPLNLMQRKNAKKLKSQILMDDSDESTDDSWSPVKNRQTTTKSQSIQSNAMDDIAHSTDSDSSCDLMEKCPICLHAFREQEIGMPNVCEHSFCAPCIEEWSSNVQTCPIDRKPFTKIRIRSNYANDEVVRETVVEAKKSNENVEEFDFTHCEICNQSDREDVMLLCDGCNSGYHMDCLTPPIIDVPDGSWYCDNCFASEMSDDDITEILAEMETFTAPETRLRLRRDNVPRITRTRQSERIRTTILNRRHVNQREPTHDSSMPGIKNIFISPILMDFYILFKSLFNLFINVFLFQVHPEVQRLLQQQEHRLHPRQQHGILHVV